MLPVWSLLEALANADGEHHWIGSEALRSDASHLPDPKNCEPCRTEPSRVVSTVLFPGNFQLGNNSRKLPEASRMAARYRFEASHRFGAEHGVLRRASVPEDKPCIRPKSSWETVSNKCPLIVVAINA